MFGTPKLLSIISIVSFIQTEGVLNLVLVHLYGDLGQFSAPHKMLHSSIPPQLPGYARKLESGGWSYSTEAVRLLDNFMRKFPVMFRYLTKNPGTDRYFEQDIFPDPEG